KPSQFMALVGEAPGHIAWLAAQAILGTAIMCLGVYLVLTAGRSVLGRAIGGFLEQTISKCSLGIFLLHPFFIDLFDAVLGAPLAFRPSLIGPEISFTFLCSWMASIILLRMRGWRSII